MPARDAKGRFISGGGGGASFVMVSDTLTPNLRALPGKFENRLSALVDYFGQRSEDHAKKTAPWTDRTTNARNGLTSDTEHSPIKHIIHLFHKVPYGIWLEVRWNGRYAVIIPTLQLVGRQLMVSAKQLLRRSV